jgi:parallel beta-helix repeat protein
VVVNVRKILILFITIIFVFSLFIFQTCSAGETFHVYTGESIQNAINSANISGGDTIYVHSGTYSGKITFDRPLTLIGDSSESTTLSNSGDHTLKITANGVNISGFEIKNTGGTYACVFLNSASNCLIENNLIKNGGNGVYLVGSNSNTIQNNDIENNNAGVYLSDSDSNTVKINNIQNNIVDGVFIASTSTDNTLYLNDFSDNDANARDQGTNNWYYGSQGNYWDDYNDYDADSNGIGDSPYIIGGIGGNQDNYPLGDFLSSSTNPIAFIDSITPNPATQGDTIYFYGDGYDDDGSIIAYEWKLNGVVISTSEDFSSSSLSSGFHTVSFRVKDNNDNWSPAVERTLVINSQNQKPVAIISQPDSPPIKYIGETIEFVGDWYDDGSILEYYWRSDIVGFLSDEREFSINNLPVGNHIIYFKVRDNYGVWSSEESIIVAILSNPLNNPPIADAGGPYSGYINQNVTFNASSSYDIDSGDEIISYQWDFGDSSIGQGVTINHMYTTEGNFTVELTVTDNNGEQSIISTYVIISEKIDQNGDDDNGVPGFESFLVIIALVIIMLSKSKKRKFKKD